GGRGEKAHQGAARPPQSSRHRDSSARSAERASRRLRSRPLRRSQYKENRDASARPKTSSSRAQSFLIRQSARSPFAAAAFSAQEPPPLPARHADAAWRAAADQPAPPPGTW